MGKIVSTILGNTRIPMLIVDQNPNLVDRSTFNARSAAIYGFSIFGMWSASCNNCVDPINNTFSSSVSGEGVFTLTYTYTDFATFSMSDDVIITVHPNPTVTTSTTDVLCNGDATGTATLTLLTGSTLITFLYDIII